MAEPQVGDVSVGTITDLNNLNNNNDIVTSDSEQNDGLSFVGNIPTIEDIINASTYAQDDSTENIVISEGYDYNIEDIIRQGSSVTADSAEQYLDKSWVKHAFLMSDSRIADYDDLNTLPAATRDDIKNKYYSSARRKFTDTRIGGNVACNPKPQFNRYADIREKGRVQSRRDVNLHETSGMYGMGRYYSEAIDDNEQTVYLRFGVPQYNSLLSFFTNAFNPSFATLTNTGRIPNLQGFAAMLGGVIGTIFTFYAYAPLALFVVANRIFNTFFTKPTSKFYTLKPTMFLYWSAVDMLVNAMVINRGLLPKLPGIDNSSTTKAIGDNASFDKESIDIMHGNFPDIFTSEGRVDILAVAVKAQMIANRAFLEDYERMKDGDPNSYEGYVREGDDAGGVTTKYMDVSGKPTLNALLAKVTKLSSWFGIDEGSKTTLSEPSPKIDPVSGEQKGSLNKAQATDDKSWAEEYIEFLDAELSQGGAFAVFKVNDTGSTSESFSNSVTESDLSNKLNSAASQARQFSFTFAGGNIGDGLVADAVEGAMSAVKTLVSSAANSASFGLTGGLEALLRGSYYDIPKVWQSSSAQLTRASYKIQLVSPYGHPLSQLQNIYIPFAMLLAGTLPRSTGSQTYTSPFLCQVYDRGRCQISLGIIDSLSITRGTTNLTFNNKGQTNGIEVSISVTDLSSIMHMPVGSGGLWETIQKTVNTVTGAGNGLNSNPVTDEDNILFNYLATITGLDLYSQLYPLAKAKLQAVKQYSNIMKFSSPAFWAAYTHDTASSTILAYTLPGIVLNALELGSRGSDIITNNN